MLLLHAAAACHCMLLTTREQGHFDEATSYLDRAIAIRSKLQDKAEGRELFSKELSQLRQVLSAPYLPAYPPTYLPNYLLTLLTLLTLTYSSDGRSCS